MRAKCIINRLASITDKIARDRIGDSIRIEGPLTDLSVGQEYPVQALEERYGGLWVYIHTVEINNYPYPYPAEFFEFTDTKLPSDWHISFEMRQGNLVWNRIAGAFWVEDDAFFDRLVEGDLEAISLYKKFRRHS